MTQDKLIEAAKALVARWDSPDWKDATHTADYIHALRYAVHLAELATQAQPTSQGVLGYVENLEQALKACMFDCNTGDPIGIAVDALASRAQLAKPQPTIQDVVDAERYRWLKPNYAMANFDIYDAEKGESKQSGIIFEMPDGLSYGADLDALIDAAMKEGK